MFPIRDTQPSYSTPMVTIALIVVNVLVFLYEISLEPFSRNAFIGTYGLVPEHFSTLNLVTSMFLHGGWMHLLGNMWFLWIFGDNIEDVLGHGKFLLFYLICGVAAGLTQVFLTTDPRIPTVGASGAIAGVMGAYMLKFPHSRVLTLVTIIFFFTTIEVPAWVMLIYWFAIQFTSGVGSIAYSHAAEGGGGVAFFAHVGGFLAGALLVNAMGPRQVYSRRRDLRW
jgi:membrane associated rhomboid family serine protease